MKVRFKVTADDIKKGCRDDENNCPVARSIIRTLGRNDVIVSGSSVQIGEKWHYTPSVVAEFVDFFDNYYEKDMPFVKVLPFVFTMSLPKSVVPKRLWPQQKVAA